MKNMYYKNHLIQKKWGQIFLRDDNIIHTIVQIINPQKNQTIIEIGPGLGALTKEILDITNYLITIERDPNLAHQLMQVFNKKLQMFNQDVMTVNFYNLFYTSNNKLRLIGNLPYNIATKLIIYLFKYTDIIYDMHFMIQKEVAERIIAHPNQRQYGRLSIITQYHYQVTPVLEISNISFFPIPKVKSMMLRFLPHINILYPNINVKKLSALTQLAFSQRRKTIRNSLSTLLNTNDIIQQGIDISARAENLSINQYCKLTKILCKKIYTQ